MVDEAIPLVAIVGSFMVAAFITWNIGRSRERRAQIQADIQSKLIERFGSAGELVTFLQSPAGREFVSGVQSAPIVATRERAAASFSRALVLTGIGGAFIALWIVDRGGFGWAVPGFILFSIGLANLVGAIVALKLSRDVTVDGSVPASQANDSSSF
jgi:hypothetical protein